MLHGHVLEHVDSAKYLGVSFSPNFSFNKHINDIYAKGNHTLGFLKRNLKVPDPEVKAHAYKSLVRPTVEYCSTVWHPQTDALTTKIESLQNRAARWAKNRYSRYTSVSGLVQELGWRA